MKQVALFNALEQHPTLARNSLELEEQIQAAWNAMREVGNIKGYGGDGNQLNPGIIACLLGVGNCTALNNIAGEHRTRLISPVSQVCQIVEKMMVVDKQAYLITEEFNAFNPDGPF